MRTRLEVYVEYLAELSRAYESLWALARGEYESASEDAGATARLILRAGAIFQTRQRLLILASQSVRAAGDVAFDDLMQLRSLLGAGIQDGSPEFKSANQSYRSSMETLREAIRSEFQLPKKTIATMTRL
jgi:hypothetical protein